MKPAGGVAALVIVVLRAYQRWISPMFPPRCRFAPTCSSYAVTALTHHGLIRGGWLAMRRVLRCQPFSAGGLDPVPPGRRSVAVTVPARPTGAPPC